MTLEEIVYQIEGELYAGEFTDRSDMPIHVISLKDMVGDLTLIYPKSGDKQVAAYANGRSKEEAREKLVSLLAGGILLYNRWLQGRSHASTLRIPETLTPSVLIV